MLGVTAVGSGFPGRNCSALNARTAKTERPGSGWSPEEEATVPTRGPLGAQPASGDAQPPLSALWRPPAVGPATQLCATLLLKWGAID
ncbi:hypothetical protein NDU88_003831 [Pleurodeles waltl]|uniref:Uncharacterized protein n=1 Tax=Pleurodeles waltl TaxID=8319 RepID=A0AAV7PCA0_PLEWA|nr:hypothetical protein NDU88_003831 [Pleurodeles waltl]